MNLFYPSRVTVAAAVSALLAGGVAQAADDAAAANNGADGGVILQEVTVTATRRSEEINKVPLNVTAYTPELMDDQGVRQIDDLARLTPDLQFTHTSGAAGNNSSNIAIRGVCDTTCEQRRDRGRDSGSRGIEQIHYGWSLMSKF